ncbi:YoaK family protein [Ktedonobacter racemifer]|uniref:DUF1275 domain-containing protein n=1 Tax=Ktedonobacter racemifer DSM 44963 TaxID=485913 RepID=D6TZY9_KTERA|nr:YoaK family protein [Ktedonobacter racemifer]EFH82129.1 protein of unknown function DUF1275 [Ktedonobacter racemifer DSM 44963]
MQQDHDRQEHIAASLSLSTIRGRNLMVLFLTCVSSSMDALSYLKLGHVFIANMTGNTILLGLALGRGRMQDVLYTGVALVGFCLGVASGAIIPQQDTRSTTWPFHVTKLLALETLVFAVFCVLWYALPAPTAPVLCILLLLSALAMGLQSCAVAQLTISGVVTTNITGTIHNFVGGLVRQVMGYPHRQLAHASLERGYIIRLSHLLSGSGCLKFST